MSGAKSRIQGANTGGFKLTDCKQLLWFMVSVIDVSWNIVQSVDYGLEKKTNIDIASSL